MRKKLSLALSLVLALSLLGGCAPKAPVPTPSPTPVVTATPTPEAGPIVLTDQAGREVTLTAPATKIVSGYYISTSACIALGLTDKMVGIEQKIIPIYELAAPRFLELPKVGSAKEFDLEGCLALEPELVILPKKLKDAAETISGLGIPVLLVNPENQAQLEEMLALIGRATGTEARAAALSKAYADIAARTGMPAFLSSTAPPPKVYLGGNSAFLTTAPREMYQASLITAAGGRNAGDELEGNSWTAVSYEQLLAMNPDVIILPSNASYSLDDVKNDPRLSTVTAVVDGAVYAMPNAFEAWDSPVPSCVLGGAWMTAVLHEDLYSMDEMRGDAAAFYLEFYGISIDTSLITK